jgi:hypothetical protein
MSVIAIFRQLYWIHSELEYDGLLLYQPGKLKSETDPQTSLRVCHRRHSFTRYPLLADHEHGPSVPHRSGCGVSCWFKVPLQMAVELKRNHWRNHDLVSE